MNAAPAISGSNVCPVDAPPARIELIALHAGEALVTWSQARRQHRAELLAEARTPEAIAIRRAAQVEAQQVLAARDAASSRQAQFRIF